MSKLKFKQPGWVKSLISVKCLQKFGFFSSPIRFNQVSTWDWFFLKKNKWHGNLHVIDDVLGVIEKNTSGEKIENKWKLNAHSYITSLFLFLKKL